MFSFIELKTAALDYGIPGVSPTLTLLLLVMMLGIPMIPYLFLYLSQRDAKGKSLVSSPAKSAGKVFAWVHAHRHPELLHH